MKYFVFPFLVLVTLTSISFNCSENPVEVKTENQRPVIFSLSVFPDVIGPQDSAIVICNAFDPDGDTLVYDWITDGKSRIKGSSYPDWSLYNTYENWRVVYPKNLNNVPIDTCWVQAFARDRKGKSDVGLINFILIKDSL